MQLNLAKQAALSAERLRSVVNYDPATGEMTWRTMRRNARFLGQRVGGMTKFGYRFVSITGKTYMVHRLAWLHVHGRWPTQWLDHINGNPADNRIANLREATHTQNIANRRPQKGRALKGITYIARLGRWQAQIRHSGRNLFLGCFNTAEEANAAYLAKAREFHGEFVRAA